MWSTLFFIGIKCWFWVFPPLFICTEFEFLFEAVAAPNVTGTRDTDTTHHPNINLLDSIHIFALPRLKCQHSSREKKKVFAYTINRKTWWFSHLFQNDSVYTIGSFHKKICIPVKLQVSELGTRIIVRKKRYLFLGNILLKIYSDKYCGLGTISYIRRYTKQKNTTKNGLRSKERTLLRSSCLPSSVTHATALSHAIINRPLLPSTKRLTLQFDFHLFGEIWGTKRSK